MKRKNNINTWISISDLMAAILAIFVVFYISQIILINKEREKYYEIIEALDSTKVSIIDKIKNNDDLSFGIDTKTGTITLNSEILFEVDDYKLKPKGKKFLKEFIPKYINILINDAETKKYLEKIVVEGHTDKNGSYLYNLELSQKRALSVIKYINSDEIGDFKGKEEMKKYLTANGRSYIDYLGDDYKSRRVEFKFVLKENEAIDKLRDIFEENTERR